MCFLMVEKAPLRVRYDRYASAVFDSGMGASVECLQWVLIIFCVE